MTDQSPRPQQRTEEGRHRNDTAHWARYVETLKVPDGLLSPNVEGHRPVGPLQGFDQMWQKTFKVRLEGASASPVEVVETWRERFPEIFGFGKGFRVPLGGLVPGAVSGRVRHLEPFFERVKSDRDFLSFVVFANHGDALYYSVQRSQSLLAVYDHETWRLLLRVRSDGSCVGCQSVLPQEQIADRIPFVHGVEEVAYLRVLPHERALSCCL